MITFGLGEGPGKARFVRGMFTRIAERYDLMNGLMTFGMHHSWRRAAARETIASPEGPGLDLATGTGDLAFELCEIHRHRLIVGGDREAYTYLPQSVDRFVGPPALAALMTDVGLRAVKYRRLGFGTVTIHTGVA